MNAATAPVIALSLFEHGPSPRDVAVWLRAHETA